jgi:hypothetical protein
LALENKRRYNFIDVCFVRWIGRSAGDAEIVGQSLRLPHLERQPMRMPYK